MRTNRPPPQSQPTGQALCQAGGLGLKVYRSLIDAGALRVGSRKIRRPTARPRATTTTRKTAHIRKTAHRFHCHIHMRRQCCDGGMKGDGGVYFGQWSGERHVRLFIMSSRAWQPPSGAAGCMTAGRRGRRRCLLAAAARGIVKHPVSPLPFLRLVPVTVAMVTG